jgi:hypothetical protein
MTKSSSLMPVTKSLLKTKLLESSLIKTLLLLKMTKPLPLKRLLLQLILLRTSPMVRTKKLILLKSSKEVRIKTLKTRTPRNPNSKFLVLEALPEEPTPTVGDFRE